MATGPRAIADVAAAAGVHVATVYELVGRKPVLLRELIEQAISGVDHAVPADDRDYVVEMRAEPDPARQLTIYAGAMRAIQARLAPLLVALRDAATTDTDAAAVWHDISDRGGRRTCAVWSKTSPRREGCAPG